MTVSPTVLDAHKIVSPMVVARFAKGRSPDGLGNGLRNGLTVGGWIVNGDPPIGGSHTQMPDGIATDHRTRAISFARWSSLDCHRTAT
jgi:hypothetical protein